jgi:hypothetical protein
MVNGPTQSILSQIDDPEVKIIDCQVEPASNIVPFGQVKDGILVLEAPIVHLPYIMIEFPIFRERLHHWTSYRYLEPHFKITLDSADSPTYLREVSLIFLGRQKYIPQDEQFLTLQSIGDRTFVRIGQGLWREKSAVFYFPHLERGSLSSRY